MLIIMSLCFLVFFFFFFLFVFLVLELKTVKKQQTPIRHHVTILQSEEKEKGLCGIAGTNFEVVSSHWASGAKGATITNCSMKVSS